jgi:hypothetical protein
MPKCVAKADNSCQFDSGTALILRTLLRAILAVAGGGEVQRGAAVFAREIPRPAGENAGLRDDAAGVMPSRRLTGLDAGGLEAGDGLGRADLVGMEL